MRWGVDLRTDTQVASQVANRETESVPALSILCLHLQGRESGGSRQKALLADGTTCLSCRGRDGERGLEGTVPQRPGGQLEGQ